MTGHGYMPHGHCYFWEPELVWLHLLSDLGVFVAYATIPAFLAMLAKRRDDLELRGVVWLFVAFILLCGFTHMMGAITIWHPYYHLQGVLKAITAVVSITTAIVLFRSMPLALSIPSPSRLAAEVERGLHIQDRLRDEVDRNEALLEALPVSVIELNSNRDVTRWVGGGTSHVAREEVESGAFDFWPASVVAQVQDALTASERDASVQRVEVSLASPKGIVLDYEARVAPRDDGGWVVVVQDITDQTRLLQSLRDSREVLEQFVYIASHDLRSPLRAVSQLSMWLEEDLGPALTGENREHLEELRNRVLRMDAMLSGLLAFSRAGSINEQATDVDLQQVFDLIVEHELTADAAQRPIDDFVVRPEGELPTIHTVRTPVERTLANLIINAVKHHDRESGTVTLAVESGHPRHWVFTVEDDGPGIAERHQSRIFQIFQTLVPKDRKESSGMGLAIVRRIVTAAGGTLEVQSPVADGRGTRFVVTWPRLLRESVLPIDRP